MTGVSSFDRVHPLTRLARAELGRATLSREGRGERWLGDPAFSRVKPEGELSPARGEGKTEAPQISDETAAALPDWVSAKNDFIHGDRSLDRIARARGMSRTALVVRAKKEGWVRLVGTKPLKTGPKPRPPGEPKRTHAQLRRDMVKSGCSRRSTKD